MPPIDDTKDAVLNETQGDADYDAAFAEAASGIDAPADTSGAAEPDAEAEPAEEPAKPGGNTASGADQSAQETPAPADQTAKVDDDPWSNAPPELRSMYEGLQEKHRRTVGQLSTADRQLSQIRNNQTNPTTTERSQPTDVASLLGSDQVKEFRRDYGEVAEPLIGMIEALHGELQSVKGSMQNVEVDREEAFLTDQLSQYSSEHPDWEQYGNHPNWGQWLGTQPRHVREAAARNSEFIIDAAEASDVLSRFKASIGVATTSPNPTADPKPEPVTDLRRARQLSGARQPGAATIPAASGEADNDFDSAFENAARKIDKARIGHQRL